MPANDTLIVFTAANGVPPSSDLATIDTRNNHIVLDFDDTTSESIFFEGVLPNQYRGGGLEVIIAWMASTAVTGDVVWQASIERHEDDAVDLDSDSFAAANEATGATASASGEVQYTTITFNDGADMDSLAAGESFRLKIARDPDDGSDDMVGDAELLRVEIREAA